MFFVFLHETKNPYVEVWEFYVQCVINTSLIWMGKVVSPHLRRSSPACAFLDVIKCCNVCYISQNSKEKCPTPEHCLLCPDSCSHGLHACPQLPGSRTMESLAITQCLATALLHAGKPSLKDMFLPIMHLYKWQQSAQASCMMEMAPLVGLLIEACGFPKNKLD